MSPRFRALICDADEPSRKLIRYYLEKEGISIVEAEGVQALASTPLENISVVLLDSRLTTQSGRSPIKELLNRAPHLPVIVSSASASIKECARVLKDGAFWYLQKPFDQNELREKVIEAYQSSAQGEKINGADIDLEVIGQSQRMMELIGKARKIAGIDSTVLLGGESGTGKSLMARFIHDVSSRNGKPFIAVSCAAIPRDLLESELFGHEKGAFTGAVSTRIGAIELAEGGTLFLDEIGDLPIDLQPKLLLFLQNRVYRRVGGAKEHKANVRIIAATHLDLPALRAQGRFRDDLYYRLNVISLELPPLRGRVEDIVPIAQNCLKRISKQRGSLLYSLSSGAMEALRQYSWPGNVRELENVLERVSAFSEGKLLSIEDFECICSGRSHNTAHEDSPNRVSHRETTTVVTLAGRTLDQIEKDALLQTLQACNWNKTMAANQLGISIKSIYNKMERLGVSEPADEDGDDRVTTRQ